VAANSKGARTRRSPNGPASGNGDGRKLAEVVAAKIELEIASRGWPIGEVVGSEATLLERYGVSRAVFREAVRIVEHHEVAAMRRGPGGGLVVTAPDLDAVVRAVTLQLQFQDIGPSQLYEARNALELACVRLAAQRITREGKERLTRYLADEAGMDDGALWEHSLEFHFLLADLTGNPALRLFVEVLGRLTERASTHAGTRSEYQEIRRAHRRIGEAVLERDAEAAQRRMNAHLEGVTGWLSGSSGDGARRPTRRKRS
jgi:DNA-binding FadR family transcriptional regulator